MAGKPDILDEEFRIKREAIVKLKKEGKDASKAIAGLARKLEAAEKNVEICNEQGKRWIDKINEQDEEIGQLKLTLGIVESERDALKKERDTFRKSHLMLNSANELKKKEITENNIHIKNLVSALAEERKKISVLSTSLEDTKNQLNLLIKQKQEIVDRHILVKRKEVKSTEKPLTGNEKYLLIGMAKQKEADEKALAEKDKEIKRLDEAMSGMLNAVREKDALLGSQSKEIVVLEAELNKERESRAYYADQLAAAQKEIAELKADLENVRAGADIVINENLKECKNTITKLESEKAELEKENGELLADLDSENLEEVEEDKDDLICRRVQQAVEKRDAEMIKAVTNPEFLENLAELEHEQWVAWSKSLCEQVLSNLGEEVTGRKMFERHQRWLSLWKPYDNLSDEIKEQDRIWARKVLKLLKGGKAEERKKWNELLIRKE